MEISTVIAHTQAIHKTGNTPMYIHFVAEVKENGTNVAVFTSSEPEHDAETNVGSPITKFDVKNYKWPARFFEAVYKILEDEDASIETVKSVKSYGFTFMNKIMQYMGA